MMLTEAQVREEAEYCSTILARSVARVIQGKEFDDESLHRAYYQGRLDGVLQILNRGTDERRHVPTQLEARTQSPQ
jgi:hypothetical protein